MGRAKSDLRFPRNLILEDGREELFTGHQALAGAKQRPHEASAQRRVVAEDSLRGNGIVQMHRTAGIDHDLILRVELDLEELLAVTADLVVNFVH